MSPKNDSLIRIDYLTIDLVFEVRISLLSTVTYYGFGLRIILSQYVVLLIEGIKKNFWTKDRSVCTRFLLRLFKFSVYVSTIKFMLLLF